MSVVFAAATNHAPGITGRRADAPHEEVDVYFEKLDELREIIAEAKLDALVYVTAEHFTNFFLDNMPAFCIGLNDSFEGPVEPEVYLKLGKKTVPADSDLAKWFTEQLMADIDLSYSFEMKFDHGVMVPLNFLTPDYDIPIIPIIINCLCRPYPSLKRCYELGRCIRRAGDRIDQRIGIIGTGGLSHWPAMSRSGDINVEWDQTFIENFIQNDHAALISYDDDDMDQCAGEGAQEIRAWLAVAGATAGATGDLLFYKPLPSFAIGGAIATMSIGEHEST